MRMLRIQEKIKKLPIFLRMGSNCPSQEDGDLYSFNIPQRTSGVKDNVLGKGENDTHNTKYDIINKNGEFEDENSVIFNRNTERKYQRESGTYARVREDAASKAERRSFCDRIRGTDTVKRRAYETAEEKITLDVIKDTSLKVFPSLRMRGISCSV